MMSWQIMQLAWERQKFSQSFGRKTQSEGVAVNFFKTAWRHIA
jgi:hypothetical protein